MLEEMDPGDLDEWEAADALDELLGQEKLYRVLALIGCAIVNSWGGHAKPGDFIPKPPADVRQNHKQSEQPVSPNQAAALFAIAYGAL